MRNCSKRPCESCSELSNAPPEQRAKSTKQASSVNARGHAEWLVMNADFSAAAADAPRRGDGLWHAVAAQWCLAQSRGVPHGAPRCPDPLKTSAPPPPKL